MRMWMNLVYINQLSMLELNLIYLWHKLWYFCGTNAIAFILMAHTMACSCLMQWHFYDTNFGIAMAQAMAFPCLNYGVFQPNTSTTGNISIEFLLLTAPTPQGYPTPHPSLTTSLRTPSPQPSMAESKQ